MTDETIARRSWLLEEIGHLESRLERLPDVVIEDPRDMSRLFSLMERSRLAEELERTRAELSSADVGRMQLRLHGRTVHGVAIEAGALESLVGDLHDIAVGIGSEVLVGVSTPGSHVIELLPSTQGELFGEAFADAGDLLLGAFRIADDQQVESRVFDLAAELEPRVVKALGHLVGHLVEHGLAAELRADSQRTHRVASLSREHANALLRALLEVEQEVTSRSVSGLFHGALEGSGRFELEVGGETLRGTVPKDVRPQLRALRIGDQVVADIDEILTKRRAGGSSGTRLRLRSISTAG